MSENNGTLTIRVIRSFSHRNWKPLVMHNVDLNITLEELQKLVNEKLLNSSFPPPFKKITHYDAFKLETSVSLNNSKSSNALINMENSTCVLQVPVSGSSRLSSLEMYHESETSYFNNSEYIEYSKDFR